jgi:uncharacterized protein YkwD
MQNANCHFISTLRMRIIFSLFTSFLLLTSFKNGDSITIDKQEALKAFALLNDIRTNPTNYYQQFDFLKSLKIKSKKLSWNDTLARVADGKAYDMANRNYYGHVDPDGLGINYFINKNGYTLNPVWLKNKEENYFESILAEVKDGESAIKKFIIDEGVPSLGHRNHLLGVGEWNASLVDIGIGFARRDSGSNYKTYVSIVIARHNW